MTYTRRGSSLVYVVLTLAVISVVLLAGSAALLSAARQRSAVESSKIAETMRQSAYAEGMWLVQQGTTQYGVVSGGGLIPVVRGFADTACSIWVTDGATSPLPSQIATPQTNCPHYELTVRDRVSLAAGATYTYTSTDLAPANLPVTLVIPPATPPDNNNLMTFTVQPPFTSITYQACNSNGACSGATTAFSFVGDPVTAAAIKILSTTPPITTPDQTPVLTVTSVAPFTVGKGFISIEATGFATDLSESRSLTTVRTSGTVTTPTTARFTVQGLCTLATDSCR